MLFGRKGMTNLDSILKAETSLLIKVCIVKAMVFPVVTYGCEHWTIKRWSVQELMLSNCGPGEDFETPLDTKKIKSVLNVYWKD